MQYFLLIALIVVSDQFLKYWVAVNIPLGGSLQFIPGVLSLTDMRNTGAAFSILQEMRPLLLALAVVCIAVILYLMASKRIRHPLALWALSSILGGAAGNALDRARLGYVVDMFRTEFMNFAVFNVADIFITCGTVLFAVYVLFFYNAQEKEKIRGRSVAGASGGGNGGADPEAETPPAGDGGGPEDQDADHGR